MLFHPERIRKRCSIITDLDAAFMNTSPDAGDARASARADRARRAQALGIARKAALVKFSSDNPWIEAFFAPHTFEVDFVAAGNSAKIVSVLNEVYSDAATIAESKSELESHDIEAFGSRVLTMAKNIGKGWFAILVGRMVDHHTVIPEYILNAVLFAHGPLSRPVAFSILSYRLDQLARGDSADATAIADLRLELENFRNGVLDFPGIRTAMLQAFPADEINSILAGL